MNKTYKRMLDKIERHADVSRRSLLRYTWSPASETGRRELERSQNHEEQFYRAVKELRIALDAQ